MPYDVEAIRKKLKQSMTGGFKDPDEFKPGKATSTSEPLKYRFFILPPFQKGEKVKGGPAKEGMEQFYISHGNHWVDDKPNPCPRVWNGEDCPICQFGFDLLAEVKDDDDRRRAIVKQWMPTTYYMVNIYFPPLKVNPEDLRGLVKTFNASKTCFDSWSNVLMRENAGDDETDPQPFGVFFDESNALLFELQVLKQGRQNSYKTSKFLPTPTPMIRLDSGGPDTAKLTELLAKRHNLFDKLEVPDIEKIKRVFATMTDGDDENEGQPGGGGGFDHDEGATPGKEKTKETVTKTSAGTKPAKTSAPKKAAEDEEDVVSHLPVDPLSDEAPLKETPKEKVAPKAKTEAPKAEPEAAGGGDNIEGSELDDLLSQLDDD